MMHSILIPHRGRLAHLTLLLWSIAESERETGVSDYEIVLAHDGTLPEEVRSSQRVRVVHVPSGNFTFNKPKFLNAAIEASRGEVLTFLDADALVAPLFLTAALKAREPRVTRLCYRVRKLPAAAMSVFYRSVHAERSRLLATAFDGYDEFPRAFEGYCNPDYSPPEAIPGQLVFGNSQFAVRRDVLGDLRFDELYVGHGFEDLDFIWRLWRQAGPTYHGVLADRLLLHFAHPYEAEWKNEHVHAVNLTHYRQTRHGL